MKPRVRQGGLPRVYYATQTAVAPPTIVVFVSKPAAFDDRYRRYLVNGLRERFDFPEVPIKLVLRERLTIYDEGERREHAARVKGRAAQRARDIERREGQFEMEPLRESPADPKEEE